MPTSVPVVAIPIVDTSNSMSYYGYVAITVIDTKAFLSCALAGDYIGVASYDVQGRVSYNLTLVDQNLTVPAAAAGVVQGLNFTGNSTNIGGGLISAVGMLASAPAGMNKGFVLLTDGYQNSGTPPIPLPAGTPAVYSCAMGPNSDQNLLRQIAELSRGQFYYAPYVYNMMQIYNQIRAQNPSSQLLANSYKNAGPYDYLMIPATVSVGNDLGQFSAVWSDPSYVFTNGQPGTNQLSVTLVNPSGVVLTPMPSIMGGAYVVFNVPNPAPGLWYIQIEYGGAQPLGLTGGAFEYAPSGNGAPIKMDVDLPAQAKAGGQIDFNVSLTDDEKAIAGQQVHAVITKPKMSTRSALATYAHVIKDVVLPEEKADTAPDRDIAKLDLLYKKNLPVHDMQPHIQQGVILTEGKDGKYHGSIMNTEEAGSYNIQLQVTGFAKKTGSPFSRSELKSVLVED